MERGNGGQTHRPRHRHHRVRAAPESPPHRVAHSRQKAGCMSTKRLVALLSLAVTLAACGGGSPSAPSPSSPLAGTWRGTLTIQVDSMPAVAAPTTWTFTDMPGGSGHGYITTIQSQ